MRVELVEDKKKKVNWWQAVPTIITAFVALLGIVVSFLTYTLTREDRAAQRADAQNNRFTYAIEHLKDESLAIRMGALFELKKLGLENLRLQESIVRILNPFIREGIENEDLLLPPHIFLFSPHPNEDIFLACEIASLFFVFSDYSVSLELLEARNLDLRDIALEGAYLRAARFYETDLRGAQLSKIYSTDIQLQGADLSDAQLQGAFLTNAQLQEADLSDAQLQGASIQAADFQGTVLCNANLQGADLSGAWNLTAKQLLTAIVDDTTLLDPDLRAEYDRLKAEQDE